MLLLVHFLTTTLSGGSDFILFANKKIFGAIINTDPMIATVMGRDFYRVPQGVNGSMSMKTAFALLSYNYTYFFPTVPLQVSF